MTRGARIGAAAAAMIAVLALAQCGSQYSVDHGGADASTSPSGAADGAASVDGASTASSDGASSTTDGSTSVPPIDGSVAPACQDAGVTPTGIDLSKLTLAGSAKFNLNADGWLTLTDALHSQAGAAWLPAAYPVLTSYTASFSLRVGPGNTYGEGIAFAVVESNQVPGVGTTANGSNGLAGLGLPGYAVLIDMYKNVGDVTDDDVTTLKIVSLPNLDVISHAGCSDLLDDGAAHPVTIALTGDTIHVVLKGPTCTTDSKTSSNQLVRNGAIHFGFTGGTGTTSDSHNEIESASITSACE